jgi:2-polyprenyl-6-methoxyphenol hydroxylase-like FAD-dependent oxidoreductase
MWRGVTEVEPFLSGRSMVIARGEGNVELIAYPIGTSLVNWVVQVPVAEPGPLPGDANWNHPGRAQDVLRYFGGWDLGWLDVAGLINNSAMTLEYPMVDRDPLPSWGQRRVTLLGDAAHPMYPVGANGASQAIIDAHVLADELARDFPEGLATYEKTRREATAAVVAANREMRPTGDMRSPEDLARVTATYRRVTGADN